MEKVCTPFCDASCPGEHHPLLQALVKCPEKEASVEQSVEVQALAQTVRQCMDEGWKKNMEIPEKDVRFRFPTLHWAAVLGRLSAVSFLVNEGFDPKLQTSEGHTALHRVCLRMFECFQHQSIAHRARTKLKRLIELLNVSLSVKDNQHLTPLLLACDSYMMSQGVVMNEFYSTLISNIGVLSKNLPLALKDVALNSRNPSGDTALHLLASSDMLAPCLSMLLLSGANPTVRNSINQLPFDIASQSGATRNAKQLLSASTSFLTPDLMRESNENEGRESGEELLLSESHGSGMLDGKASPHAVGLKRPPSLKPARTVSAPIAAVDVPVSKPLPKLIIKTKEGAFIATEVSSTDSPMLSTESSLNVSIVNAPTLQSSSVSTSVVGQPRKLQQKGSASTVAPPPLMSYATPSGVSSIPFSSVTEGMSTFSGRRDITEKLRDVPELVKPSQNSHEGNMSNTLPSAAILTEIIANRSGEKLITAIDDAGANRKVIDRNGVLSGSQAATGNNSISLVQHPTLQLLENQPHAIVPVTANDALRNVLRVSTGTEFESQSMQSCGDWPSQSTSHKRKHSEFDSAESVEKMGRYDRVTDNSGEQSGNMLTDMEQSHLHSLEKYVASQAEEMDMSMRLLEARKTVNVVQRECEPSSSSTQYETLETLPSSQNVVASGISSMSTWNSWSESGRSSNFSSHNSWFPRTVNSAIHNTVTNGLDGSLPWLHSEQLDTETEPVAAVVPPLPEVDSFLSRIRELMMSSDAREVVHMLADAEVSRYKRRMEEGQRKYQAADEGASEFEVRHGIKVSLVRSLTKQVDDLGSLIERFSDQHDECLYKAPRLDEKLSKLKEDFMESRRVMKAHDRMQTNLPHLYKSAARKKQQRLRLPLQLVAQVDRASVTDQHQMATDQHQMVNKRYTHHLLSDSSTAGGSPIHQPSYH